MVKKHDFIQINYTGRIKGSNEVFDTTIESVAKDNKIFNPKMSYKPVIICVGERQLIKGLDDKIIGKEIGKTHIFEIQASDAFGKKDAKLIKLVPSNVFKKEKINPFVGLEVNMDGQYGVIRSINGGRTLIDFNHPLSGKDVNYEVEIIKKVDDKKEQLNSLLSLTLNIDSKKTDIREDEAIINENIPEQIRDIISLKIKEVIPSIKKVTYK